MNNQTEFNETNINKDDSYIILTDSCIDLTDKMAKDLELEVIPLSVSIQGKEYYNYLDGRDITPERFYDMLRENAIPVTSQINPSRFLDVMTSYLEKGLDILYIGFSSALSGTYQSSVIAKEELQEKFPERKIITVDSLCASMGQGLLLTYAAEMKKKGNSIDEVSQWVEVHKQQLCHLFTVGDLNHLRRGGRLSFAKALLGTILRVKPLLQVNKDGKLVQTGTTRGRTSALLKMFDRMKETIENPKDQVVYISHGDCWEEAQMLREKMLVELEVKDVIINYVGPVIGAHSGIGTLAIFYLGTDRVKPY